jgi:hypothetical protein
MTLFVSNHRHRLVFSVLLAAATLLSLSEWSRASEPPLRIQSRSVVFSYPQKDPYDRSNHYGFNHAPSVARLDDGRLLCVWFSGPFEASVHQVILASYSFDDGRNWEKPFVLQDQPRASDFDPALIVDGRRVWFFYVYGRWNRYPFMKGREGEDQFIGPESYHLYSRWSDDSGKSWSDERLQHQSAGSRSNGIRLTTGELLLPAHDFQNRQESGVLKSNDQGQTWRRVGRVLNPAGVDEPTIAELKNGNILMALRTRDGHLWTALSRDKGENWSKPKRHQMLAAAASHNLFRVSDGRVLLTHDECKLGSRSPLTMRLTEDADQWEDPLILAESAVPGEGNDYWGCQVTYPSVCELPGKILLVVWAHINMSNTEQFGDISSARVEILD